MALPHDRITVIGTVPIAGQGRPDLPLREHLLTMRDICRPASRNFHISHVADVYMSPLVRMEMSGDRMPPLMQVADSVVDWRFPWGSDEGKLEVVVSVDRSEGDDCRRTPGRKVAARPQCGRENDRGKCESYRENPSSASFHGIEIPSEPGR
jgi:hypothetical protein